MGEDLGGPRGGAQGRSGHPHVPRRDLLRMGVTLAGHQQRILDSAQSLQSPPKGDPHF